MNESLIKNIYLKVAATFRLRPFSLRRLKPAATTCLLVILSTVLAQDLNQAQRHEARGQLALAKAIYEAFLTNKPFNPSVYNSYYRVSFGLKNYQEFLTFSLNLLKNNPQSPELLISIGEAYLKLDKKKEGLNYLQQSFSLAPDLVGRISTILSQEKMFKDGIRFLLDYRKLKKRVTGYEPMLIDLYEADNDYQKAAYEITEFLNANPAHLPQYEAKLRYYLTKTNPSIIFRELNRLTNKELRARLLSKLYLSQNRYPEAVAEIKTLGSETELYGFARFAENQEQYPIAAELYQELGRGSDQARVLRKMGKVIEATEVLKQVSGIEARFELAELQRIELKDNQSAKENYLLVIKQRPTDQAYYGLVASLMSLGQLGEAKKYLAKIGRMTDHSLFTLSQIYFYEGQFDSCKNYISELSKNFPASPLLNDALEIGVLLAEGGANLTDFALASFNYALNQYDDGINIAKKLINQSDKVAEYSFLLLARLYLAKKEPNLGLSALQELKTKFPDSRLLPKAKFEQAKIYSEKLKDEVKYQQTLEELIVEFPSSPYSSIARNLISKAQKPEPIH
jgi:tetratricopeptide (TPR) repeat protein